MDISINTLRKQMRKTKVLRKSMESIKDFLERCAMYYVSDLQESFATKYSEMDKGLMDFNRGYEEYFESLSDLTNFGMFCERQNVIENDLLDTTSPIYSEILKTTYKRMVKVYQNPFVLKTYFVENTHLGRTFDRFLEYCARLFVETALECESSQESYSYLISDKDRWWQFCCTLNHQRALSKQIPMDCSMFRMFFEDYFHRINLTQP